jgi:ankyrin repeat protein
MSGLWNGHIRYAKQEAAWLMHAVTGAPRPAYELVMAVEAPLLWEAAKNDGDDAAWDAALTCVPSPTSHAKCTALQTPSPRHRTPSLLLSPCAARLTVAPWDAAADFTPLLNAVNAGAARRAQQLLAAGCRPQHEVGRCVWTAVVRACSCGQAGATETARVLWEAVGGRPDLSSCTDYGCPTRVDLAVVAGDAAAVATAIAESRGGLGRGHRWDPVELALQTRQGAVLAPLVAGGADLTATVRDTRAPLMSGGEAGAAFLRALLAAGVSCNAKAGVSGGSLLHAALHALNAAAVRVLLDAGADLDGRIQLHVWALLGDAERLLTAAADAPERLITEGPRTPLVVALHTGNVDLARAILQRAAPSRVASQAVCDKLLQDAGMDPTGVSIVPACLDLHREYSAEALTRCARQIARCGHTADLDLVLALPCITAELRSEVVLAVLQMAVVTDNVSSMSWALAQGVAFAFQGLVHKQAALAATVQLGAATEARRLLDAGAVPNMQVKTREYGHILAPLVRAAAAGHLELVRLMLPRLAAAREWVSHPGGDKTFVQGADAVVADAATAASRGCHVPVVVELCRGGWPWPSSSGASEAGAHEFLAAAAGLQVPRGLSPHERVARVHGVVRAWMDCGAAIRAFSSDGRTLVHSAIMGDADAAPVLLAGLIASGVNMQTREPTWLSPLSLAVQRGNLTMVQLLLDAGARMRSFDERGQLSFAWARRTGPLLSLLTPHVDVHALDPAGRTPLHCVLDGRWEAERLVWVGADPMAATPTQPSCLTLAWRQHAAAPSGSHKRVESAQLLLALATACAWRRRRAAVVGCEMG